MLVCAEFSGSAGEAPTGIKVGVEALSERPQGGGDGSWPFSRGKPSPHTCPPVEREGPISYPASQQCHLVVGL